jgi:hypothetical protein
MVSLVAAGACVAFAASLLLRHVVCQPLSLCQIDRAGRLVAAATAALVNQSCNDALLSTATAHASTCAMAVAMVQPFNVANVMARRAIAALVNQSRDRALHYAGTARAPTSAMSAAGARVTAVLVNP